MSRLVEAKWFVLKSGIELLLPSQKLKEKRIRWSGCVVNKVSDLSSMSILYTDSPENLDYASYLQNKL